MVTRFDRKAAAMVAGVAATFVFLGAPAQAQEGPIVITAPSSSQHIVRVAFTDLNLATRQGEEALYRRISHAVETVCLHDVGSWYGMSQPDFLTCTEGAWRGARPQMIGVVSQARQLAYNRRR